VRNIPILVPFSNFPLFSFPGQEHLAGCHKIPTVVYYDQKGSMKAGGDEVTSTSARLDAVVNRWTKVELCALSSLAILMLPIFNALTTDSSFDSGPKPWNST
jgi:hypothetical protein